MTRPLPPARVAAIVLSVGAGSSVLATAVLMPGQWAQLPAWWHLPLLAALVGAVAALGRVALGHGSPVWAARVLVAAVALGMATLPELSTGTYTQQRSPWIAVFIPAALTACGLTTRRWPAALAVGLGLLVLDTAVRTTDVFDATDLDVAGQAVYDLTVMLTALGILLALTYTHRQLSEQAAGAARSYLRARTVEEVSRHHAQWDALLHDEVLATLETVAQGTPEDVRRAARAAAGRLREGPQPQPVAPAGLRETLLEAVLETHPLAETRFWEADPDAVPVPAPVASALATSLAEALRNAATHAYPAGEAGPVLVEAWHFRDGVLVVVGDHGRGFRRSSVPATSFGITISIEDRMAAVGGSGLVRSTPGHGTRVELSWPRGGAR